MIFRPPFVLAASFLALNAKAAIIPITGQDGSAIATKRDIPPTHILHERGLSQNTATWEKRGRVPPNAVLPMRIGLKQSNLEVGHDMLMDRSSPGSPNFGNHLSVQQVIDLFAPSDSSVREVIDWVASAGIPKERISQSTNKQWVQFDANATDVENLLFTDYYIYEHLATGTKNVACDEYHVPENIRPHIDYITPGIRLRADPKKVEKLRRRRLEQDHSSTNLQDRSVRPGHINKDALLPTLPPLNVSVCDKYVTPDCIRAQYYIPEGKRASPGNELGIFESLNDHYGKQDLDQYFANVYPKIPNGTYPIEKLIDGAIGAAQNNQDQIGAESDLDFQAAWPLIWPQKTILFQTDDQYYEINQTDEHTPYLGFWNSKSFSLVSVPIL